MSLLIGGGCLLFCAGLLLSPWHFTVRIELTTDFVPRYDVFYHGLHLFGRTERPSSSASPSSEPQRGKRHSRRSTLHGTFLLRLCRITAVKIRPSLLALDPAGLWLAYGWLQSERRVTLVPSSSDPGLAGWAQINLAIRPLACLEILLPSKSLHKTKGAPSSPERSGMTEDINALIEQVEHLISTKTVIGEPMTAAGVTLIPLTTVSFGLGTGKMGGDSQQGGGAGTGFRVTPVAVIVIRDNDVSVLPVTGTANAERLLGMVPDVWAKITGNGKKEPPATI